MSSYGAQGSRAGPKTKDQGLAEPLHTQNGSLSSTLQPLASSLQPSVRIAAIIPARMRSSRFPGKPLLSFRGLPMIEHVRRRVVLSEAFGDVVVATCDREIAEAIEGFGGRVIMTAATHPGATDRIAEAMEQLDCTHVVNVQGDEILILPEDLVAIVRAVEAQPAVAAWNAVGRIESAEELTDPSIVKLFVSVTGRVFHCARACGQVPVTAPDFEPLRKSIGIMAFTRAFLREFIALPRTPLESREGIDQLRMVERDLALHTVLFGRGYPTINEPREVALVEACFSDDARQQAILQRVLAA